MTTADAALRARIVDCLMSMGTSATPRTPEQIAADDADTRILLAAKVEIDAELVGGPDAREHYPLAMPKAMKILRRRGA